MAGVEWGLARPQFNALEALQSYGAAAQQRERERAQAGRQQSGAMAATGDFAGARRAALSAGDFDIVAAIGGLEQDKYQQLSREFDTIGKLHPVLKQLPIEQRAQTAIPILRQAGFSDQELAGFDWSDQSLDGVFALSQSGQAALKQQMEAAAKAAEPYTLAPGAQRMVGGEIIAENNNRPPIWDAESGQLIYPGAYAGARPEGLAPGASAGEPQQRMAESLGRYGLPPAVVAGFMGNFAAEGGYTGAQGDGGTAGGVAQWRGDRRANFARVIGKDPTQASMEEQAAFVRWELDNPQAAGMTIAQRDAILRAETPEQAAALIDQHYERSSGEHRNRRIEAARQFAGGGVVQVRPPRQKERDAPSGYEWTGDGSLRPIRGGPADPGTNAAKAATNLRKEEATLRRQFDSLPEVKRFKDIRASREQVRSIMSKPNKTAQDDIALVFSYMKMLDPGSVVREGEYATAQNAASVPENIRNLFNRAASGNRLNDQQRKNMAQLVDRFYQAERETYNARAQEYQGYAKDYGLNPARIARRYVPDQKPQRGGSLAVGQTVKRGGITVRRID